MCSLLKNQIWKSNTMNERMSCRDFNITWVPDLMCHLQLQDSGTSSALYIRNQTGKIVGLSLAENQASSICQVKEMVWSLSNFWGGYTHINLSIMTLIYSKLHDVFLEYKITLLQKIHGNSAGKKYRLYISPTNKMIQDDICKITWVNNF